MQSIVNNLNSQPTFNSDFIASLSGANLIITTLDVPLGAFFNDYSFQLFMCDLQSGLNKLEVADEYILPILFSLNINKNKSYNPVALKKRIETALELITISDPNPMNLIMIGQLNLLNKLADVCIDYEVDVKCTIEVRA